jgi:acetyl esterase/lipase
MRLFKFVIIGIVFDLIFFTAGAQTTPRKGPPSFSQSISFPTVSIWNGDAPNSKGNNEQDIPALSVFTPQQGQSNGTAVVIAPGGAYFLLASNLEGRQIADWFTARGVTAFVLRYRLGPNYLYPIPLQDAQRAIRYVRANAKQYGVDPNRVGMIGFSAGGHLAAMTATSSDYQGKPNAPDSVDRLNAKPDFLVLGYSWNNAMLPSEPPYIGSYQKLMRMSGNEVQAFEKNYTPALLVTKETPPTFIYSTTDDKVVHVSASVDFYTALVKAGVPAELHLFAHGDHGLGLGGQDPALEFWPALLSQWLRAQGMMPGKK